ncbi:MAG: cation transporter [Arenimonas sp.]|nr:cation transporter [Arenimonas sp.]
MKLRYLFVLALAGTCGWVPLGQAAEPLRLPEAVARALATNPTVAAEAAQLQAVRARTARDTLPPPYVVGGEFENFAGSGSLRGADSAETTLRISRVIELGGKRAAREALGQAQVGQQSQRVEQARIDIASRTTARFIEVLADQQRLDYARERVSQAERTRDEVAAWVRAARNPETDLHAAELAVAEAQLEVEHAEHELDSARMTLAASWGSSTADFESVEGDLQTLPDVEDFAALAARLPETPEQLANRLQAETVAARRRVGETDRSPDVNLSLGVRRIEGLDDQGLVMSVSVPLGNRSRAAYSLAEADAELAALEARREADLMESQQILFEKVQELRHARTEAETLRDSMLPTAEAAVAQTRRGFEAGRFSFYSLAQAQATLFRLRERAVEAATRYHLLLVEVERLTANAQDDTP